MPVGKVAALNAFEPTMCQSNWCNNYRKTCYEKIGLIVMFHACLGMTGHNWLSWVPTPRQPTISSCLSVMPSLGKTSYWTSSLLIDSTLTFVGFGVTFMTCQLSTEPFPRWSWTQQLHPSIHPNPRCTRHANQNPPKDLAITIRLQIQESELS